MGTFANDASTQGRTVFSIATLDVFALAMGVFMLIAVVLFPYYMKNEDAITARDQARVEVAEARAAIAAALAAQHGLPLGLDSTIWQKDIAVKTVGFPILPMT